MLSFCIGDPGCFAFCKVGCIVTLYVFSLKRKNDKLYRILSTYRTIASMATTSTRITLDAIAQRKLVKDSYNDEKYDILKEEICAHLRDLLKKIAETANDDRTARVAIAKTLFDHLIANKWFMEKYDRFRYVARAKLVEFMSDNDIKDVFLPYWKSLYDVLECGVELEVETETTLNDESEVPHFIDFIERTCLAQKYTPFRDSLLSVHHRRTLEFEDTKTLVLAFRTASIAGQARMAQ